MPWKSFFSLPIAMELAPPPEETFETFEACFEHIQQHARNQGYAITTKRSKYIYADDQKQLQTAYLHCCKSGTYRNRGSESKNERETTSRLIDCPFRASIRRRNSGTVYIFQIEVPNHNYDPLPPIALPQHRGLDNAGAALVAQMTQSGTMPRHITTALRLADPDALVLVQDIYNERRRIRQENLAGQSPIEAMLRELQKRDYFIEYKTHISGEVTDLFFAHPKSVELFKRYPEVLIMDCTYKTN